MEDRVLQEARAVVEKILRERRSEIPFDIRSLDTVIMDDGDEFLWIRLVYDGEPRILDIGMKRELRNRLSPELEQAGVSAYPVLSFGARSEMAE